VTAMRLRTRRLRHAAGFTLLEVMIAIAVIAFAFVGLLGLHGHNIQIIAHDQSITRATLLARGLISQSQLAVQTGGVQAACQPMSVPEVYRECRIIACDVSASSGLQELSRIVIQTACDASKPVELVYFVRDPSA
jgi:prepilin-type N-terminal cleavage/methylation domain-containing protein